MIISTDDKVQDPVSRAQEVYRNEWCPRSFEEDFDLHVNNPHAIVYKDATNLALLRPVKRYAPYYDLTHPRSIHDDPDCWWVYLLVGDFRFLLSLLPYPLTYIGWERNNVPRSYNLDHLKRWTLKDHTTTPLCLTPEGGLPGCTKEERKLPLQLQLPLHHQQQRES